MRCLPFWPFPCLVALCTMSPWRGAPPPFYPSAGHTAKDRCALSEILPAQLYLTNFKGADDIEALKQLRVSPRGLGR